MELDAPFVVDEMVALMRMRPFLPAGASRRWLMFTTLSGESYDGTNGNIPSSVTAIAAPAATHIAKATNDATIFCCFIPVPFSLETIIDLAAMWHQIGHHLPWVGILPSYDSEELLTAQIYGEGKHRAL